MSSSTLNASFVYDGDGRRVKSETYNSNGSLTETILFIGAHYEVSTVGTTTTYTKYYFAGATRVAMRKYTIPKFSTLTYLLGDHLGSTSVTTNSSGALVSELRYKAWGETRYSSGTTATNYRYTGQREESGFGLYFYNARWVDVQLGRFAQADTIVPGGVQGLDRYAYVGNSPVRYTDPSGHCIKDDVDCWELLNEVKSKFNVIFIDPYNKLWDLKALSILNDALSSYQNSIGKEAFKKYISGLPLRIRDLGEDQYNNTIAGLWKDGVVTFDDYAFQQKGKSFTLEGRDYNVSGNLVSQLIVAHELTHILVERLGRLATVSLFAQSTGWANNSSYQNPQTGPTLYSRATDDPEEDLADTVAVLVVSGTAFYDYAIEPGSSRYKWYTQYFLPNLYP